MQRKLLGILCAFSLVLILLLLVVISIAAQERATPYIYALSNPVVIPPGQTSATVTLVWDGGKDHPYAEVWIRVDQNDETFIVEQGKGTRNEKVEFGRSYEFKLSDSNVLLASVRVTVTHETQDSEVPSQSGVTPGSIPTPSPGPPEVAPSNFAGCWTFAGKGSFARSGLGCFKQKGDRVSFEDPVFEGIVVGNTLRFTIKPSDTNTAYAFRSGRFLMHKDGKSFIGSINTSLNPDDNDYPVTATLDKSFKKKSK